MHFSLRAKMFLLLLSLLLVPWVGYQHIQKTEDFLRQEQANHLQSITKTISVLLKNKPQYFQTEHINNQYSAMPLYAPNIKYPIQLDGYFTDWEEQSHHTFSLEEQKAYYQHPDYTTGTHQADVTLATHNKHLLLFLKITDADIVYHQTPDNPLLSDHIKLSWVTPKGELTSYILYTSAPGSVNAQQVIIEQDAAQLLQIEHQIQAVWQENQDGYQVEVNIPQSLMGSGFAINVINVNKKPSNAIHSIIGTSGVDSVTALSQLIYPSQDIATLLSSLTPDKTSIWVVDQHRRVLGQFGSLSGSKPEYQEQDLSLKQIMRDIYRRIVSHADNQQDSFKDALVLNIQNIHTAFSSHQNNRLIATHPITNQDNTVMGAVVAEKSNQDILILQSEGIIELINSTLLILTSIIAFIVFFATRIALRIKRLQKATEAAISADGRIHLTAFPTGNDELGELAKTFQEMLNRLNQYNRYLETMASNLAHEIRTPVAIVKSSLEHLEMSPSESEAPVYILRAKEGIMRLSSILNSMSEATQIEQSLQHCPKELIPLQQLLEGCIQGYQTAYPNRLFTLNYQQAIHINAAPESLAQALDKLIDNAVEFSPNASTIKISMSITSDAVLIHVENQGALLPDNMRQELFHSMVSIRQEKTDKPHLGLGLYIVRLVAEYHQGSITADNLADHSGVVFTLRLPYSN
ncbi:MAG: HAMP domain-containing protein [Methylococcales bacterium]|jgi:two-component system, OmpR family, sensor histidine kinase ChvG|nr:HAMP domain-containing protein [Methylococcales bacterium]MBT7443621.1 HAMP domain-containing protein [Methylococcales bacterium]